jgi:hypothetical protein
MRNHELDQVDLLHLRDRDVNALFGRAAASHRSCGRDRPFRRVMLQPKPIDIAAGQQDRQTKTKNAYARKSESFGVHGLSLA